MTASSFSISRRATLRNWAPAALLAPSVLYLAVFLVVPLLQGAALSFQGDDGAWGTGAIETMLADSRFVEALTMTIVLTALVVPLQVSIAVGMTMVIHARLKRPDVWLYLLAIPIAIGELATGILWFSVFTEQGWLNSFLQNLGLIDRPAVFLDYRQPLQLVVLVVVAEAWRSTALMTLILVSGLNGIPKDVMEAASVLGATTMQRLRKVMLPLLMPSLRVAITLRAIFALQAFAVVVALTGRGITVLASEAYQRYTFYLQPNVASAYAMLILLISFVITGLLFAFLPAPAEDRNVRR